MVFKLMDTTKSTSRRQVEDPENRGTSPRGGVRRKSRRRAGMNLRATLRAKPGPWTSLMSARYGSTSPRSDPGEKSCFRRGFGSAIRLRPDNFREPPIADPHDGLCGEGWLNTVPYPNGRHTWIEVIQTSFRDEFHDRLHIHTEAFSIVRIKVDHEHLIPNLLQSNPGTDRR
jgi:hypothetical protein